MYPEVTKVEKGLFSQVVETGKGWLSSVGAFLTRSSTRQSEDKEDFTPPPAAAMAKQCLPFYLEPYRSLLLNDGEYPKVDAFVKEVKRIYTMHMEQRVQHCGIPAVVTIRDFQAVSHMYAHKVVDVDFFFTSYKLIVVVIQLELNIDDSLCNLSL